MRDASTYRGNRRRANRKGWRFGPWYKSSVTGAACHVSLKKALDIKGKKT